MADLPLIRNRNSLLTWNVCVWNVYAWLSMYGNKWKIWFTCETFCGEIRRKEVEYFIIISLCRLNCCICDEMTDDAWIRVEKLMSIAFNHIVSVHFVHEISKLCLYTPTVVRVCVRTAYAHKRTQTHTHTHAHTHTHTLIDYSQLIF